MLAEGERLAAERHSARDREAMQGLDTRLREFNPLLNTTSALYKKLKKKRRRGGADSADAMPAA